jgi:hypothetical protein
VPKCHKIWTESRKSEVNNRFKTKVLSCFIFYKILILLYNCYFMNIKMPAEMSAFFLLFSHSILAFLLEKGKPLERAGRKASGLSPDSEDKAAGLPGAYSIPSGLS